MYLHFWSPINRLNLDEIEPFSLNLLMPHWVYILQRQSTGRSAESAVLLLFDRFRIKAYISPTKKRLTFNFNILRGCRHRLDLIEIDCSPGIETLRPQELVDINLDLDTRRRRFRRRILRVVLPVGCVLVVIATILGIALFSYTHNREDALALSADLLKTVDRRIATEVSDFLSPASQMIQLAANILTDPSLGITERRTAEALAINILNNYKQLTIFSMADTDGEFLMLKKMPTGAIDTKIIEGTGNTRQVRWLHRDVNGRVVNVEETPDDTYDPRTRPWYMGAVKNRGIYWTDVYVFFTDQKPGLTASLPVYGDAGELRGVLGLDIELERLSGFLHGLWIGRNGTALIIDEEGRLVAYPEVNRMLKKVGDVAEPVMLTELDDPVLTRAYNRFRVEGYGTRQLVVGDQSYLNTVSSLRETVGRDWTVLILMSEDEIIGFIGKNFSTTLMMASVIVFLAAIMAGLLAYQGLRADRNALLVQKRKEELEAQSGAFADLASRIELFDPNNSESLGELTEIVCATLDVRRVSVWYFLEKRKILRCEDCFDRETGGHTQGTVLKIDDFPHLFEVLKKGEEIAAANTAEDFRTSELHLVYLQPLSCTSLLSVAIKLHGQTAGAIWFEHEGAPRNWDSEDIAFARAIAGMLALRFSASGSFDRLIDSDNGTDTAGVSENREPSSAQTSKAIGPETLRDQNSALPPQPADLPAGADRKTSFSERLIRHGYDLNRIGADLFEDVAVLVLRFTDPLALAEPFGEGHPATAIDHLVCHFEDLVASYGLDYWKIMSDQIICAAGMAGETTARADVIADVALNLQNQCTHLFADLDKRMEFRIGIDTGGVIGSSVGRRHRSYNIWGEAVQAASVMADTGVTGGIHVSQSTYLRLRTNYLFKARGRYYVRDMGEISTYLLTGRI